MPKPKVRSERRTECEKSKGQGKRQRGMKIVKHRHAGEVNCRLEAAFREY